MSIVYPQINGNSELKLNSDLDALKVLLNNDALKSDSENISLKGKFMSSSNSTLVESFLNSTGSSNNISSYANIDSSGSSVFDQVELLGSLPRNDTIQFKVSTEKVIDLKDQSGNIVLEMNASQSTGNALNDFVIMNENANSGVFVLLNQGIKENKGVVLDANQVSNVKDASGNDLQGLSSLASRNLQVSGANASNKLYRVENGVAQLKIEDWNDPNTAGVDANLNNLLVKDLSGSALVNDLSGSDYDVLLSESDLSGFKEYPSFDVRISVDTASPTIDSSQNVFDIEELDYNTSDPSINIPKLIELQYQKPNNRLKLYGNLSESDFDVDVSANMVFKADASGFQNVVAFFMQDPSGYTLDSGSSNLSSSVQLTRSDWLKVYKTTENAEWTVKKIKEAESLVKDSSNNDVGDVSDVSGDVNIAIKLVKGSNVDVLKFDDLSDNRIDNGIAFLYDVDFDGSGNTNKINVDNLSVSGSVDPNDSNIRILFKPNESIGATYNALSSNESVISNVSNNFNADNISRFTTGSSFDQSRKTIAVSSWEDMTEEGFELQFKVNVGTGLGGNQSVSAVYATSNRFVLNPLTGAFAPPFIQLFSSDPVLAEDISGNATVNTTATVSGGVKTVVHNVVINKNCLAGVDITNSTNLFSFRITLKYDNLGLISNSGVDETGFVTVSYDVYAPSHKAEFQSKQGLEWSTLAVAEGYVDLRQLLAQEISFSYDDDEKPRNVKLVFDALNNTVNKSDYEIPLSTDNATVNFTAETYNLSTLDQLSFPTSLDNGEEVTVTHNGDKVINVVGIAQITLSALNVNNCPSLINVFIRSSNVWESTSSFDESKSYLYTNAQNNNLALGEGVKLTVNNQDEVLLEKNIVLSLTKDKFKIKIGKDQENYAPIPSDLVLAKDGDLGHPKVAKISATRYRGYSLQENTDYLLLESLNLIINLHKENGFPLANLNVAPLMAGETSRVVNVLTNAFFYEPQNYLSTLKLKIKLTDNDVKTEFSDFFKRNLLLKRPVISMDAYNESDTHVGGVSARSYNNLNLDNADWSGNGLEKLAGFTSKFRLNNLKQSDESRLKISVASPNLVVAEQETMTALGVSDLSGSVTDDVSLPYTVNGLTFSRVDNNNKLLLNAAKSYVLVSPNIVKLKYVSPKTNVEVNEYNVEEDLVGDSDPSGNYLIDCKNGDKLVLSYSVQQLRKDLSFSFRPTKFSARIQNGDTWSSLLDDVLYRDLSGGSLFFTSVGTEFDQNVRSASIKFSNPRQREVNGFSDNVLQGLYFGSASELVLNVYQIRERVSSTGERRFVLVKSESTPVPWNKGNFGNVDASGNANGVLPLTLKGEKGYLWRAALENSSVYSISSATNDLSLLSSKNICPYNSLGNECASSWPGLSSSQLDELTSSLLLVEDNSLDILESNDHDNVNVDLAVFIPHTNENGKRFSDNSNKLFAPVRSSDSKQHRIILQDLLNIQDVNDLSVLRVDPAGGLHSNKLHSVSHVVDLPSKGYPFLTKFN
jgi:hypothetical protein